MKKIDHRSMSRQSSVSDIDKSEGQMTTYQPIRGLGSMQETDKQREPKITVSVVASPELHPGV